MVFRSAFILALCAAIPASATATFAYMIDLTTPNTFGTINLNSGAFSSLGVTEVGATTVNLAGLGEVGNTLYGEGSGNTLYTVNTSNGQLTQVGVENTISIVDFGSTLTTLYALSSTGSLYSVSPVDASVTLIGSTTVGAGGTSSLSTGSSVLYLNLFNSAFNLYTLDQGSGAATLVGATNRIGGLMWSSSTSTLWGGTDAPDALQTETINITNGNVTNGSALTGAGTTFGVGAFAPLIQAPEPATWALAAIGLMLCALRALRSTLRA